jgi:uroporphyrinogen decarboxylase
MYSNKDWIKQTIAHKQTPAVPYNFMFSPPAEKVLTQYYGRENLEEQLNLPIRMNAPRSIKPLYASPEQFGASIKDEFGVTWTTSDLDRGAPVGPPLVEPDLSGYTMPNPEAPFRFEGIEKWCEDNREHFTAIWIGDLWERATFVRGMENLLLDVVVNPKFVEELLRCLTDYILQTMQILFDRYIFDAVALSDDYGTQNGLLISPADWCRIIKPCVGDIYSFAKKNGRFVFHHSCGNVRSIIGEMIDIGLDILHPIQPEVMDIFELKREFGRDLTFCGGLGTQRLLPYGSCGQIREEISKLKEQMGVGGGYILEPGITTQADVPLENMLAMIEEAQR